MPPRKKTSKPRASKPRAAKPRVRKSATNVAEFASLSCVRTMTIAPPNPGATVTDTMYNYNTFQLADFPRAVTVASAYQHYRICGVKLTFKPAYDTYQQNAPGGPANTQKCNLYYMIDKSDGVPTNITLEGLKNLGARPKSFDEKPISVTWKPSVIFDAENTALNGVAASYKISPWLSTNANTAALNWNPSRVAHKGIKWYMEQPGAGVGETTVYVEVELQFQFKKALVSNMTGDHVAVGGQYPALDSSPDGVVGGSDQ